MANSLIRWDPFSELQTFRTAMDRQFDQIFGRAGIRGGDDLGTHSLGLDVIESNDSYVVKAAMPGMDPKDVDIRIDDDVLTISGQHRAESEHKDENYIRRELQWGSFHRSMKLPPAVDAEKADAKFENGVMALTLPKRPEARSRSFKVTPQGVIDSTAETKEQASGE